MRNRKLLSLLVTAACNTLAKSLTGGRLVSGIKPGIVSLIQTHSDSLDWNCHLHMVVTNGAVDYTDLTDIKFKPCGFWDFTAMTELFRFELIEAMFKKGVLTTEVANNLVSWKNSGFGVHASEPFMPDKGDILKTRLAYAFRPAVTLNRLVFDGGRDRELNQKLGGRGHTAAERRRCKTVTVQTRKQTLKLGAVEFLAKLTLHIPDRYQNIRRYAGFYASIVQCAVKKAAAAGNTLLPPVHETKSVRPNWAALISKIFGALPIACPKCGAIMELKEFILNEKPITRMFPDAARAPPTLTFDRYLPPEGGIVYGHAEDDTETGAQFCQLPKDDDAFFNQENSW